MEIRVLGPIEITGEDGPVRLTASMPRRLLAALAIGMGQPRSADTLIDALWGESPPASASKLLQIYVSQLRKLLGPTYIRTFAGGYALEVDESLDAIRFERLLEEGREALRDDNPALAGSRLGRALDLWRGSAYADVAYEEFASAEAERLEELRRVAIEERIEAGLARGRHKELLAELSSLATAHPLRERLQGQMMLALYRCGRQADALERYATVRTRLRNELGLEPGRELRALERRILQHDHSLLVPPREAEVLGFLPRPANTLVGRDRELSELRALLVREDARLLVLTGAGGSGKTRLALEAANETASSFANGAAFVSLGALRDPELVVGEISRALGVRERPGQDQLMTFAAALRTRELLLVLDNVEHLRAAAPALVELIARAPRLTVLVTSRVVLHVSGEHVYPVKPLNDDAAAALFTERAREADPHFSPDRTGTNAIHTICKRLDGLPLAIELAASHTRALTPVELLEHLDPRLPLLSGGPRDLPARQQTLRATLEWSLDLLEADEVRHLTHVSVFTGGFTLEAAEAVCGSTVTRLSLLIDHNLLQRTATQHGSRYSMLETIREYAVECLEGAGEADEQRRRHAEYFCRLAEEVEAELEGAAQTVWLEVLGEEHDNVRAALEWCFGNGDAEVGARLASSLSRYWYFRGHVVEGRRWIDQALSASSNLPAALEIKVLRAASSIPEQHLDLERHKALATRRLGLARKHGDARMVADCLNGLGLVASAQGDSRQAEGLFRESVSMLREVDDENRSRVRIDVPLGNLSRMAFIVDDLESADAFAGESMAIAREREDPEQIFDMTLMTSLIRIQQDRIRDAIELGREAVELADQLDSKAVFLANCTPLAVLLARQGRHKRAAQVLGKRRALRDELGRTTWFEYRVLADAEEQVRQGLTEETLLKEMNAGASADVRELFRSALQTAEEATLAGE